MGSFNVTCFASGQTIGPRDRCYIIPVVQAKTFNPVRLQMDGKEVELWGMTSSSVGSHAFWVPVAWPMEARYDDFGEAHIRMDSVARVRLFSFLLDARTNCPVVLQGKNPTHEIPLDFNAWLQAEAPELAAVLKGRFGALEHIPPPNATLDRQAREAWQLLFSVMLKSRLFYGTRADQLRSLDVAYLSGHAYDALVAHTEAQTVRWSGASMNRLAFAERVIQESFGLLDEPLGPREDITFRRMRVMDRLREKVRFADTEGCHLVLPYRLFADFVDEHIEANTRPTPQQLVDRLGAVLTDQYMLAALNYLNIKFSPLGYCGQDFANVTGQAYAKFVAGVCEAVTKDRRADV